jgi:threonine dehydratase
MSPDVRLVDAPTARELAEAAARVAEFLRPTPVVPSQSLGALLKVETAQPTGSFKVRGALAALSRLRPGERVVTASAGNHALGIAYAALALDRDATIVCPANASPAKIEALRRYPVSLLVHGSSYDDAEAHAIGLSGAGLRYVSAYNDPDVIAGQATLALELFDELEPPFTIVCPVGGGGLASGIALAANQRAGVRVIGVETEASPAMRAALGAGRLVRVAEQPTLADGLAGNLEPGSVTFEIVRRLVADVVLVTEDEIARAIRFLASEHGLVVEGAGAAATAAVLAGRVTPERQRLVVLVTGRNIALDRLARVLRGL